jgi:hypothetical protein
MAKKKSVETRVTAAAISQRAYALFLAHGGEHGHDVEDWLLAEAELREGDDTDAASPAAHEQRRLGSH